MTGLDYERFRNYSPSLGTWISQDPLSYVNGANTYQFVESGPVGAVDPSGETIIGSIYYIIPTDGLPYIGSSISLSDRLRSNHPQFQALTDPSTRIAGYSVDAGDLPLNRAELNHALRAAEQSVMDEIRAGGQYLCNLRNAAIPANRDLWLNDLQINIGQQFDIPNIDQPTLNRRHTFNAAYRAVPHIPLEPICQQNIHAEEDLSIHDRFHLCLKIIRPYSTSTWHEVQSPWCGREFTGSLATMVGHRLIGTQWIKP